MWRPRRNTAAEASSIPFALPDIGPEEIAAVVDTLRSGWITSGPKVRQFEESFQRFIGDGVECVAVNSATAGLHLALEACGVQSGDEVIVPTHTFAATAEVVRYIGADVAFADIDPNTYCIDPGSVERCVTPRTRAIIPVHFGGLVSDMDAILKIAERFNLKVIEDAAHAFPSEYHGKLVGTLGSGATVFSFHATKTLTTGEGGMLVTKDHAIAQRARVMRTHGIDRDAFSRTTAPNHTWRYEIVAPGFKYNMTDIQAALGLCQLRKLAAFQRRRREIVAAYHAAFAGEEALELPVERPEVEHAWHLYALRLRPEALRIGRDQFIEELAARNIGTSVHFIPVHLHPFYRDRYGYVPESFPVAYESFTRSLSLPLHPRLSDEDVADVIEAVYDVVGTYRR
jgi:dTDP-4-amino-4,6-dideoxygalactose transaminase